MGAWGHGPYDNDSAADWYFKLTEMPIADLIEEGLNSNDFYIIRAASWLLQQVGYNYVYPSGKLDDHRQLAVRELSKLIQDKTWISTWNEPSVVYSSIMGQIYSLGKKR